MRPPTSPALLQDNDLSFQFLNAALRLTMNGKPKNSLAATSCHPRPGPLVAFSPNRTFGVLSAMGSINAIVTLLERNSLRAVMRTRSHRFGKGTACLKLTPELSLTGAVSPRVAQLPVRLRGAVQASLT